jgi:nucleotide-binding universal stress UspA family protein
MAIKDILLHLDNSPGCQARIDLAIQLAQSHGAHIKGLHVISHSYYAPRHTAAAAEEAKNIETLFIARTAAAGVSAEWLNIDWSVVGVRIAEIITIFTYYTDLVIIGQPTETTNEAGIPFDLPERLGLAGGKPLLIVPYAGDFNRTIERIMVAWKAGRESSRTLYDAMPLLERAKHLSIVTVAAPEYQDQGDDNDIARLDAYLSRHERPFTHDRILAPATLPVGDALLNHACEQKMDLLVMGGFAASRRGAFMLGPVARHLMNHMTVPVLLSH